MLYKKNNTEKLDMQLFKNPTAEYRGAPFWAWNCELCEDELLRQIECLKKMGFGGFHIHSRTGMATKYLSEEYMNLVKSCVKKAKSENMLAWIYDEDRYPSGFAGGFVTKDPEYRQRCLLFTVSKINETTDRYDAAKSGSPFLLGMFDVVLNKNGELVYYTLIEKESEAKGNVWYAYVKVKEPTRRTWYNGQTYADLLNPKTCDKFIEITHEAYKRAIGDEFGKTVPAVFTDEPEFAGKGTFSFAESREDVILPWTWDFDLTYKDKYGIDIRERIPELFWELPEGKISRARYCYHDHVCELLVSSFMDKCGEWCEKNDIALTGHVLMEETLFYQTRETGEAMRSYRSFGIPGIDMLFDHTEYSTAKQAQSMVHQYGREGMTTELYGVTNWDFDFRGHKFQGDWQAALGATVRVPHLAWVSMKGTAKRDYPASINFQSPWYCEYPYIEDHFARLNTVLTRGKPVVRVGVIHPIESYWLHWGPSESTYDIRRQMDENFENIIEWLIFGKIDFDFISEACLPELCGGISEKLTVGKMEYAAVLVPCCESLRKTTFDILKKFSDAGGKVIFAGSAPKYIDAAESTEITSLYEKAVKVPFERYSILQALENERDILIKKSDGTADDNYIYQLREDGNVKYLFIANGKKNTAYTNPNSILIKINGEYTPSILDTIKGEEQKVDFTAENGYTIIPYSLYQNDSLLFKLERNKEKSYSKKIKQQELIETFDFKDSVSYYRAEENVCILDIGTYSFDGGEKKPLEEILRIDKKIREEHGWQKYDINICQPWADSKEDVSHFVTVDFSFFSEEEFENIDFCCEGLNELYLNGEKVKIQNTGYFVDKAIKKYSLPKLRCGENIITVSMPFGKRTSIEACYLTGDFDVSANGCKITLKKQNDKICFGNIVPQGMPFYGGNLTYKTEIFVPQDCDMKVIIPQYKGALTKVFLDGEDKGRIVIAPYELDIENVSKGKHIIEFILFGNRYNTFGPLHYCGAVWWCSSGRYYSEGNEMCYEYNTKATGILKSPVIKLYKN